MFYFPFVNLISPPYHEILAFVDALGDPDLNLILEHFGWCPDELVIDRVFDLEKRGFLEVNVKSSRFQVALPEGGAL